MNKNIIFILYNLVNIIIFLYYLNNAHIYSLIHINIYICKPNFFKKI
jgi:hypothetical protein